MAIETGHRFAEGQPHGVDQRTGGIHHWGAGLADEARQFTSEIGRGLAGALRPEELEVHLGRLSAAAGRIGCRGIFIRPGRELGGLRRSGEAA